MNAVSQLLIDTLFKALAMSALVAAFIGPDREAKGDIFGARLRYFGTGAYFFLLGFFVKSLFDWWVSDSEYGVAMVAVFLVPLTWVGMAWRRSGFASLRPMIPAILGLVALALALVLPTIIVETYQLDHQELEDSGTGLVMMYIFGFAGLFAAVFTALSVQKAWRVLHPEDAPIPPEANGRVAGKPL